MNRRRGSVILAATLLLAASAFALDTTKLKPTGYVNDFAHALDARNARTLEAYCGNVERLTGAQFAVVIVDSLEGDPIEDAANKLYRQWGIGKKGTDEGLLLMLAIRDHKQRVEVGYGLEPIIPDGYAGGVLRGIRPILRQGDYGGAVLAAMEEFGQRVADAKGKSGELENPTAVPAGAPVRHQQGIPLSLLIGGFLILLVIFNIIGRLGGGGGGTGFLAGMLLGNLMGRRGGGGGGWDGGGFGGGGGGGGGFGGFGGGDSGGGGASSGW